jgi:hypothetical protein
VPVPDPEQFLSSRADEWHHVDGYGLERVFVVLPPGWKPTATNPAAQATLRPGDDRVVLAYHAFDTPGWNLGDPWKAGWQMRKAASDELTRAPGSSIEEQVLARLEGQAAGVAGVRG